MKLIHSIIISVFAKEEDGEKELEELLFSFFPNFNRKDEILLRKTNATGLQEKKITIFTITVTKERHIKEIITHLNNHLLQSDKNLLLTQKNRLDENCYFYLRLDKEKLLDGDYKLTDSGNCVHIKMLIASYPKRKEIAQKTIKEIFK